jgi:hypothetical protein
MNITVNIVMVGNFVVVTMITNKVHAIFNFSGKAGPPI